jgi:hypothetical protein
VSVVQVEREVPIALVGNSNRLGGLNALND